MLLELWYESNCFIPLCCSLHWGTCRCRNLRSPLMRTQEQSKVSCKRSDCMPCMLCLLLEFTFSADSTSYFPKLQCVVNRDWYFWWACCVWCDWPSVTGHDVKPQLTCCCRQVLLLHFVRECVAHPLGMHVHCGAAIWIQSTVLFQYATVTTQIGLFSSFVILVMTGKWRQTRQHWR